MDKVQAALRQLQAVTRMPCGLVQLEKTKTERSTPRGLCISDSRGSLSTTQKPVAPTSGVFRPSFHFDFTQSHESESHTLYLQTSVDGDKWYLKILAKTPPAPSTMPSDIHREEDTIFRNIKLIATPWNLFVYIIHPCLCCLWMMFTGFYLVHKVGPRTNYALFTFALAVWPVCMVMLAMATGEKIASQLEQAGYVQRRTRAREVDLLLNSAVFGAFWYWAKNYESDGKESALFLGSLVLFGGLMIWWIVIAMSIGSVLWFTVKVRGDE